MIHVRLRSARRPRQGFPSTDEGGLRSGAALVEQAPSAPQDPERRRKSLRDLEQLGTGAANATRRSAHGELLVRLGAARRPESSSPSPRRPERPCSSDGLPPPGSVRLAHRGYARPPQPMGRTLSEARSGGPVVIVGRTRMRRAVRGRVAPSSASGGTLLAEGGRDPFVAPAVEGHALWNPQRCPHPVPAVAGNQRRAEEVELSRLKDELRPAGSTP